MNLIKSLISKNKHAVDLLLLEQKNYNQVNLIQVFLVKPKNKLRLNKMNNRTMKKNFKDG